MAVVCNPIRMGRWSELMVVYVCQSDEVMREADANETSGELGLAFPESLVKRQSSKLRMTPAFEASLVLNSLSLVAWASLLLCLVRMRFCWENTLSQLAVWRGSVRAICDSLMRSGSSFL